MQHQLVVKVDVARIDRGAAADNRKSRTVQFRVTNDEDRWLVSEAAARGVTVSRLLRLMFDAVRQSM
jgi:hypothetical protein